MDVVIHICGFFRDMYPNLIDNLNEMLQQLLGQGESEEENYFLKNTRKLAKELGISMEETMAVGDSGNDAEMLKAAGLGVAMGNASKAIKDISDVVTLTNEECGVAHAIETYILNVE